MPESFSIRKIDYKEMAINFFKGIYNDRKLPENKIKGNSESSISVFSKEIGTNNSSEVYRFKDKGNNIQTVFTTNHSSYSSYLDKSKEVVHRCGYCKRSNMKCPIGIPIEMEIDKTGQNVTFHVIGNYCDFGCALSYLKRKLSENRRYRGAHFMNSEQMLYCLFYRVYPSKSGENIKEKPDWELLRENGGCLTDAEFDSDSAEYIPIASVAIIPSKKQYLKLNIKK